MCSSEVEGIASVVRHARLTDWAELLAADGLTREGLIWLRGTLADDAKHGLLCPHGLALLLHVIEALAPLRGIEATEDDLWPRIMGEVPDTPAGIDRLPPAW